MSNRQAQDTLNSSAEGDEYWLYVVDQTETDTPCVYPIPWTRNKGSIRYGFYASCWTRIAEGALAVSLPVSGAV